MDDRASEPRFHFQLQNSTIPSLSVHFLIYTPAFSTRLGTSQQSYRVPKKHLLKEFEFRRWSNWKKKNEMHRYLLFKAKKHVTAPHAPAINNSPAPASSRLQAWPRAPGHCRHPIDSGRDGGFGEKKDGLSLGIDIAFLKKNFFISNLPTIQTFLLLSSAEGRN